MGFEFLLLVAITVSSTLTAVAIGIAIRLGKDDAAVVVFWQ